MTSQTDPVRELVASQDLPVGTIKRRSPPTHGYTARLWKIVTVDGVEESRKVYNNSTYKASNEIYSVVWPMPARRRQRRSITPSPPRMKIRSARRSASGQTGARRPRPRSRRLRLRRRPRIPAARQPEIRLRERIRAEDRRRLSDGSGRQAGRNRNKKTSGGKMMAEGCLRGANRGQPQMALCDRYGG